MKKKIYVSGKISGIENEAIALFENAEKQLIKQGYKVINPMKLPHNHDKSWQSYMKEDIKALCGCDEIFMLNNWLDSKGAVLEQYIASLLGLKINYEN